MYQYFYNLWDSELDRFLRLLTFLSEEEIAAALRLDTSKRQAQKLIAEKVQRVPFVTQLHNSKIIWRWGVGRVVRFLAIISSSFLVSVRDSAEVVLVKKICFCLYFMD